MSLSTNWRVLTGSADNYICSRSGNDAQAGTAGAPYESLQNNFDELKYLRGVFPLSGNIFPSASSNNRIIGDGKVILLGNGFTIDSSATNNVSYTFDNLCIFNTILNVRNSADSSPSNVINCELHSCSFELKGQSASNRVANVSENLFKDCVITRGIYDTDFLTKCTFINTSSQMFKYRFCAFFEGSRLLLSNKTFENCALHPTTAFGSSSEQLQNATLLGDADTIGNTYADGEKFTGTATIGGLSCTFTNCFYTINPAFNNVSIGDYTLTPASPLVNAGATIGKYTVGLPLNAQSPAFTDAGASYTNVTPTGTKFILNVAQVEGTVTSTDSLTNCITLPFASTISQAVQAFGTFLYSQGEWIDKENYNPATNPEVRLTWEFAALDENTLLWGPFVEYEVGVGLETDNTGLGNGNVSANMQNLGAITAKRFRVRFTIRTNGV